VAGRVRRGWGLSAASPVPEREPRQLRGSRTWPTAQPTTATTR
jgi:hypothetical protein